MGIKGFVDLELTISSRGVVEDASVLRATPRTCLRNPQWRRSASGNTIRATSMVPSEARVKVHLEFGPGK